MRVETLLMVAAVALGSGCPDHDVWDWDGDGFRDPAAGGEGPFDCDDGDATIHPFADEICDGKDNDCDDLIDVDDPSLDSTGHWYLDLDGDGYGQDDDFVLACEEQDGRANVAGDCDDDSVDVHPGAAEIAYDGIDNDCADGDACDLDGDGFDSVDCPAGGTDCKDDPSWSEGSVTAAQVHPGPGNETWYDGVDQDCSGGSDFDQDGDGYGCDPDVAPECARARGSYDCGSDPDVVGCGDCDDFVADVNPGRWELPRTGADEDCDGHVDKVVVDESTHLAATYRSPARGGASTMAGVAILPIGDTDSDGHDDFLIGVPGANGSGLVDLVSGARAEATTAPGTGSTTWSGYEEGLGVGSSLGQGSKFDGFLVGGLNQSWFVSKLDRLTSDTATVVANPTCPPSSTPMNLVQVGPLHAASTPSCNVVSTFAFFKPSGTYTAGSGDAKHIVTGPTGLGRRMAAGDVDGRSGSKSDLVMTTEEGNLAAYALLDVEGYPMTFISVASFGLEFRHNSCFHDPSHPRGLAVLDFDGDGTDDIAIGCPGYDDGEHADGALFVVQGRSSISGMYLARADWVFYGVGGALGATVASAGDADPSVDGDEILVSDPRNGTVYLLDHTAVTESNIDTVALPFTTSYGGGTINAVGVGDTNAQDGADFVLSFHAPRAASEAYLLTWGP